MEMCIRDRINAYRGTEELDQDQNGIPDPIEIGKQAIEQQKINQDAYNIILTIVFKQDNNNKIL